MKGGGRILPIIIMDENMNHEMSMAEAMEGFSLSKVKDGDILEGTVLKVNNDEIFVNINYFADGVVPREELTKDHNESISDLYHVGDPIKVIVLKSDDGEGNVLLSKIQADAIVSANEVEQALTNQTPLKVKVMDEVKGGLRIFYKGLSGFMPASLVSDVYVENLKDYTGKTLDALVEEYDETQKKLIFSRKAYLKQIGDKNKKKLLNTLKSGDTIKGTVANLATYGAFIDLGGLTGLCHISDISHRRIDHPSEVLSIGDTVTVHVLKVDLKNEKISLSLKNKEEDPWLRVSSLKVGQHYDGVVRRLLDIGAIVLLENGIDGLVHISEISNEHISHPKDVLQEGQQVRVKVLEIDEEKKRVSFTLREGTGEEESYYDEEESVTLGDLFKNLLDQLKEEK